MLWIDSSLDLVDGVEATHRSHLLQLHILLGTLIIVLPKTLVSIENHRSELIR